ncbi:ribonuclease H-like domain-containing protein, partial [Tanacetum coccineum]
MDKCNTGLGYNAISPPYTRNFMPPKSDLVYPSLDGFVDVNKSVSEYVVEKPTVKTNEPKTARKKNEAPIIEDWVFDSDKENVPKVKTVEMFNKSSFAKIDFVKSTENMVPRTVLNRPGPISVNTARPVNTVQPRTAVNNAGPMKNVINAYSTTRRPFNKTTASNNSNFTKKVNTVKGTRVNTARSKVVISAVKGNKGNVGNPQQDLRDKGVINSGCSRHMTGNISYLTDYEEIDGGFVAFGGNSKGGKFTRKVPRKDNMYSVDLKNVVPQGGLTCLFEKATPDESNLWHRRLGHVNFKTMNKLVRGNLVRGIKNLIDLKVKAIRCDNRIEFNNKVMNQFCEIKGRKPALSFMRPFGCLVTILNTIDHLGSGPNWLFDIDALTKSMNYKPVVVGNQSNGSAGNQSNGSADPPFSSSSKDSPDDGFKPSGEEEKNDTKDPGNKDSEVPSTEEPRVNQEKDANVNSTNNINIVSLIVNAAGIEDNVVNKNIVYGCADDPNMPDLEEIVYSDDEDVGAEADINNLDACMLVSPIPTTRIHKDHPVEQIIGDLNSASQIRRMTKNLEEYGFVSTTLKQRTSHKDLQNCFLSQEEPKKVVQALKDPIWIEAMHEELLQFKLQEVWTLVELPNGKRGIGTKWVFRNKKDERGIV